MLPSAHRLTAGESFRRAIRTGRRAGSRTVVVHVATGSGNGPAEVGFVVSKAVGNAVHRNRVKRRLRHLTREHLTELPASGVLVVRALPASAEASYADLGSDLARCLTRALSGDSA